MIELDGICRSYVGETYNIKALDNISCRIEDGEFVSIMGRSGSGKTTLLNILGLLDTFDSGKFLFLNNNISNLTDSERFNYRKKYIAFIFQNFALINHCTVFENVALPLEAMGKSRRECRKSVLEVLEQLNIGYLINKYPGQISGGEKQRVAIARALIDESRLILADEPTGSLDSDTAGEIMNILKSINETGKTIIVVTHDDDIAVQTGRKIILDRGRICSDVRLG